MPQLNFYTTAHCSLCEHTLDLLLSTPELSGFQLRSVDIADHPELLEHYGHRIPVLEHNGVELSAPIDKNSLLTWLSEL